MFLHGGGGSGRTYRWLERDGAIRLDFRGHGESERAPGTYRIADYVEDVGVLRADRPAALVGHSLGGVVAWSVAQQGPDLVTARSSRTRRCTWASRRSTRTTRRSRTSGSCGARAGAGRRDGVERGRQAAARSAVRTRRPDALTRRRAGGARVRAAAPGSRGDGPVIDGSLLAGTDVVSPVDRAGVRAGRGSDAGVQRRWRGAPGRRRTRGWRSCASRAPATASTTSARTGTSTSRASRPSSPQREGGPRLIAASVSAALPRHQPSFSMYQVRSV